MNVHRWERIETKSFSHQTFKTIPFGGIAIFGGGADAEAGSFGGEAGKAEKTANEPFPLFGEPLEFKAGRKSVCFGEA